MSGNMRLPDGTWSGYFTINGSRVLCQIDICFNYRRLTFEGQGVDADGREFAVSGTFTNAKPYRCTLERRSLDAGSASVFRGEGFREGGGKGGLFGRYKTDTTGGDWSLRPGNDDGSLARMREKKRMALRVQLSSMGFDDWLVDEAVKTGNIDKALAFIDQQMQAMESSATTQVQTGGVHVNEDSGGVSANNEESLTLLLSMGFERDASVAALEAAAGNVELALDILSSQ